ncbi:MOSC domain-containing protein YiiM [Cohaesibacter sp. ES.047]|uniref:MOSC domain-containing protein n=1 Tax=Cohaesibacter sp. ES.047 TaxID=1798205 RepID=UPI000BB8EA45|nr:MOSC domain-containing protein [Cohaesibacter sp. ES.047]SNY94319.1 MOSC domain-containing protein YiiM [Cohaesibacter sp. ES.047]
MQEPIEGRVLAVCRDDKHAFSKDPQEVITLIEGLGVDGDAHKGALVQHRSRVRANPNQPNLRQVHLMHSELFDEVAEQGFAVKAGDLGENITTRGVDLLSLPTGAILHLGDSARVEITGLRNPCAQIESWQPGLLGAVLVKGANGSLQRKAGIMGVVLAGGVVRPGDSISVTLPPEPHTPLERV